MNKNKLKRILFFSICTLCVVLIIYLAFNPQVFADVGNNNRYDSGSSDSDGFDIFFLVWILFDLLGPIGGLIALVIIGIVVSVMKKQGKFKNFGNTKQYSEDTSYQNDIIIYDVGEKIREIDPYFSEEKFISWARDVFIKIQQAWSDRDWKVVRPFESNELFEQHKAQLDEYIKNKKINKVEKIAVKYSRLINFEVQGDKEVITMELHAVMRDYVVDEKTNKVLESDPNADWNMEYIMMFTRKTGLKTEEGLSNKSTTNCPNCGAPTEITSAGQCEYCRSVITTGEHDWVLTDIRKK